ncbi:MAG: hypothetical protein L7W43_13560, partial [Rubripirellula sp.]|nr:hypothetical protein [Rubripirellula sp.]
MRESTRPLRVNNYAIVCLFVMSLAAASQQTLEAAGITSLTNPKVRYERCQTSYIKLERGEVSVIVVDNAAL